MRNAHSSREARGFIGSLESLRGVAALAVAVSHCVLAVEMTGSRALFQELVLNVTNGRGAVCVFFVLSGFVLTLSLRRSAQVSTGGYTEFVLRRMLRIAPVCVLVGAVVCLVLQFLRFEQYPAWASDWFRTYHHQAPGWAESLRHMALLDYRANPVTWSLEVEVVASLLLPLLYWLNHRLPWWGRGLLLLGLMVLAVAVRKVGFITHWRCVMFWFAFYAGLIVAEHGEAIWARIRCFGSGLVGGAGLLYVTASRVRFGSGSVEIFLETLAAVILVLALAYGSQSWLRSGLERPALRFYGRISYSFYLVHFPILSLCIGVLHWWRPDFLTEPLLVFAVLALVSIALATAVSQGLYEAVEKPFIRLAKHLCARWARQPGVN